MGDSYVTATHPALNSVCCYTLGGKPPCLKKKIGSMWVVAARRPPPAVRVGCCPAVGRCLGPWGCGSWRPRGHWAVTPGVGHGLRERRIVGSGFPSRCRMCHWTQTVVLRVRGPLARLAALSSRPMSPFVVPAPGSCPGRRGVAPRGEACCSGPCFGRCTPCGRGSVFPDTAWRLWFGSWFGRCSPCAVTSSGPVPGRWCRAAVCGCSSCFGYTPCGPGSGYAGVLRYL